MFIFSRRKCDEQLALIQYKKSAYSESEMEFSFWRSRPRELPEVFSGVLKKDLEILANFILAQRRPAGRTVERIFTATAEEYSGATFFMEKFGFCFANYLKQVDYVLR